MRHGMLHHPVATIYFFAGTMLVLLMTAAQARMPLLMCGLFIATVGLVATFSAVSVLHLERGCATAAEETDATN